jgi:hypothetical protein
MLKFSDIEHRYRTGDSLTERDRLFLEELIKKSDDSVELQSALYIYGMNFPKSEVVSSRADHFINHKRIPGLTSTCLKVLADVWQMHETYETTMEEFLNYELYDEWYDEVAVCTSFFVRNPQIRSGSVSDKLTQLRNRAAAGNDVGLLSLFG